MKAVRAEKEELYSDISFPVIIHVNKDGLLHYIVVYGIKKNKIIVADPAMGTEKRDLDEFINIWTGVLVFLNPSEKFQAGNEKKGIFERFFFLISPNKALIMHITIATLINTFWGF